MNFLRLRTLFVLPSFLSLIACSHTILTSPIVSMTKKSVPRGAKFTSKGPVDAEFCSNDTPVSGHKKAAGLMDEAILKGQKQSKSDYIRDAKISRTGAFFPCITVQGEGVALVK